MNVAAEFQAALPEPQTILGLRLKPLSLGRYRLLKRFDSPFVADDARELPLKEVIGELFFALLICGLGVGEFKSLVESERGLKREAARFGKHSAKIIGKQSDFNINEHIARFQKYLSEATAMPWHVATKHGEDGSESASHWSHAIEVTLRSKANWTQEEIDEEPMSKALADFFKLLESEGAVSIYTHETWDFVESTGENNAAAMEQFLNQSKN